MFAWQVVRDQSGCSKQLLDSDDLRDSDRMERSLIILQIVPERYHAISAT